MIMLAERTSQPSQSQRSSTELLLGASASVGTLFGAPHKDEARVVAGLLRFTPIGAGWTGVEEPAPTRP